jgi:hypothetical protein
MPLHSLERSRARLQAANTVILPLLRAAARQRKLARILGSQPGKIASLYQSRDYTLNILVYTLPAGPQLVVALYASTQESRPLSPRQLAARLRRLASAVAKLRGKLFNQADIVYALYAPAGLTRGALHTATRQGITIATRPEKLAHSLARYLKTRYNRLIAKLRGRRVWGPVPLLAYMLAELAAQLGAEVEKPPLDRVVEAALRGGTL